MKSLPIIFFLIATLVACTGKQPGGNNSVSKKSSLGVKADTTKQTGHGTNKDSINIPTPFLVSRIPIIESAGFIPDTARIKKVGYYAWTVKSSPVFFVKGLPFYKMDTVTDRVFSFIARGSAWQLSKSNVEYDAKPFRKVKSITGFYFTDKNFTGFQTDGFMEEWEFANNFDAGHAETELGKIYMLVYFNSLAYLLRNGSHLYILYSRSDWYSNRLEKLFKNMFWNVMESQLNQT